MENFEERRCIFVFYNIMHEKFQKDKNICIILYYIILYYSKCTLFINGAMFAHAEFFNVYNTHTQTK